MKISPEQVQRVGELARLQLSSEETLALAAQLSRLVAHFEQLDELDTSAVEPTSHVLPLACPQRSDVTRPSLARALLLSPAPLHEDGYFVVPKIID
ncbi:MAG: Asp-tRNA(Asn)/Glu-tRNA(Gln) amidotransferase subunit GatC [Proteobacteria bacterium]|nr:Asp-tRNA(Asn)/Glu-tRNA(Gln) amidotransferase subunit GatC [Pseudomonadota bacterium]